ncbi:Solute carrier family 49 member A3 [Acropora cervicornis]|uniref:Solute carrier family 49 member A3 n=1 Tax=Acropora cervicornis TaxID=6130 RepID=A0AAD9R3I3_ACRCE|nr:Solute carrier family 49 member A3 [Acropora cervicornis]
MWILDVLGLRTGILLGAWLNGIGAVVRILSGMEFVPSNFRFLVVVIGQTLAALAQPFLLCAPTKLAGVWFGANERGTANMIASLSNPVGVMIANVLAPVFVTKKSNIPQMLKYFSIPALLGIAMATLGVCSSTPPTPPTASAEAKSEPFFLGLRKKLAGIAGAVLIAVGLAGGAVSGIYIDKTKKFEEAAKMSFGCATISCCVVTIVTSFSGLPVLLISSCGLFGFFAFALMPVCLEVGVECTYPVAEATSAGLQWMAGQATGIVFILICQVLEVPRKLKDSKCLKKTSDGRVADFKFAMYFMSAAAVAMAILLICTFKPTYKRLEMERKKEATRILSTETSQQRLPDIPDSSSDIFR